MKPVVKFDLMKVTVKFMFLGVVTHVVLRMLDTPS
jgi:hypothetical protein